MASEHTVSLDLPSDLYERVRQIAAQYNRSVEAVLLETLRVMFGALPAELDLDPQALKSFSEAQLWGLVHRRLAWPERERYSDLVARSKAGTITATEAEELDALVDQIDRYTVLRARALRELQRRGHDVAAYFNKSV